MDLMVARVIVSVLAVAVVVGGLLLVLSFVVPKLRFARGKTNADRDHETGHEGPRTL